MISIKFFNFNEKNSLLKSIVSKTVKAMESEDKKTIKDSSNIEVTSGTLNSYNDDYYVIEFTIKKKVAISKDDIFDKHSLDKFLFKVRDSLKVCKMFGKTKYRPINMR